MIAEQKIDGLSFSATYRNRHFVLGATRGDGTQGEDVTENLLTIASLPRALPRSAPADIEIRGEAYMPQKAFERLNEEQKKKNDPLFANPRNAAAGALRQLDSKVTASRGLRVFAYGSGAIDAKRWPTHSAFLEQLREWNFDVPDFKKCNSVAELLNYYESIGARRSGLGYDIDGVVYKVDRLDWQQSLGFATTAPRWAIAHKFPAERAETILTEITVQVGRTGSLTPVANLQPINVGGVLVARATLHNAEDLTRKDIREKDTVVIQRAGDVIPQIVRVLIHKRPPESEPFRFSVRYPDCPVCHSRVIREEGEAVWRCTGGLYCDAQALEHLSHFVSRDAFDIEGLGEKQLEELRNEKIVRNPVEIFTLETRNGRSFQLESRQGWGKKSVENLFKAINDRRIISLERFIVSLGIPKVGQANARLFASAFGTYESWLSTMLKSRDKKPEWLVQEIREQLGKESDEGTGIGPLIAGEVISFFSEGHNVEVVEGLKDQLTKITPFEKPKPGKATLADETIVFTGELKSLTRSDAEKRALALGAKVTSSVSKKTTLLVAGPNAGSKLADATKLKIKVINEEAFLARIRDP